MKKFMIVMLAVVQLSACQTMEETQLAGTVGGAALGAAVTPDDRGKGALIGGTVGLLAGTLVGKNTSGGCVYQRSDGTRYVAACPN